VTVEYPFQVQGAARATSALAPETLRSDQVAGV
jgi:hypothetical protein